MRTHNVCGCTSEDCRLNGCLMKRKEAGGFYAADSADCGYNTGSGRSMSNQQSINDILMAALQEIREPHGFAAHTIRVEWLGTIDRPSIAITRIEVEGSVNDALEQGQEEA